MSAADTLISKNFSILGQQIWRHEQHKEIFSSCLEDASWKAAIAVADCGADDDVCVEHNPHRSGTALPNDRYRLQRKCICLLSRQIHSLLGLLDFAQEAVACQPAAVRFDRCHNGNRLADLLDRYLDLVGHVPRQFLEPVLCFIAAHRLRRWIGPFNGSLLFRSVTWIRYAESQADCAC